MVVIAGPNGTGKTSFTHQVLEHKWLEGCEYINPDDIAQERFGDWNSPEAVANAAIYATDLRYRCLNEKRPMAFETVFSSLEKIEFLIKARKQGYFIRLFFIGTEGPEINASRIAMRLMKGGHGVPLEKVVSRYKGSVENLVESLGLADRIYVYDNSSDGVEPELQFRIKDGKIEKIYHKDRVWATQVRESMLQVRELDRDDE